MTDEQQIRDVIQTWLDATNAGDLPRVLALIDDDAIFIGPGRPPMDKPGFAAASRAMEGSGHVEASSDIREVRVFGGWAYVWNQISVTAIPRGDGPRARRSGPALAIFRKGVDGRWRLFRDANMVTPEAR
jgi:uncharacterized protein (TIGR02246 family)